MANLLVVDDEPDVLDALARALRLGGHNVSRAASAADAIALSKDHAFDLVVLDYIMPAMSGIALLNGLRDVQPTIRSIIVSGKIDSQVTEQEIVAELRESIEADAYLRKPLDNAKLLETIQHLLDESAQLDWKQVAERNLKAKKRATDVRAAERKLSDKKVSKRK